MLRHHLLAESFGQTVGDRTTIIFLAMPVALRGTLQQYAGRQRHSDPASGPAHVLQNARELLDQRRQIAMDRVPEAL